MIEPWQYPSITPLVRQAIKRRYELIPYTYSLCLKSHLAAVPPQRWTGWGYEHDPSVWTKALLAGDTQYWFGDALLIAGVYEEGNDTARVYLPRADKDEEDFGYVNTNAPYQMLASGKWHDISSTWHASIAVIARCGSAIPVGKNRPTTCRVGEDAEFPGQEKDDWRGVEVFPPPVIARQPDSRTITFSSEWLEDDGISCEAKAEMAEVSIAYTVLGANEITVKVVVNKEGTWEPLWLGHGVDVILPVGEERSVKAKGGVEDRGRDAKGRRVWNVQPDEVRSGIPLKN